MRVRTIEVPICDRCNRDAQLFKVVPMTSEDEAFVIARCPKHLEALKTEGEPKEESGPETNGNGHHSQHPFGARTQLLSLVVKYPGESPKQYGTRAGVPATTYAGIFSKLHEQGLVKRTGQRRSARYFPTPKGEKALEAVD